MIPPSNIYLCLNKSTYHASRVISAFMKWAFGDSNPGPSGYEPDALTN